MSQPDLILILANSAMAGASAMAAICSMMIGASKWVLAVNVIGALAPASFVAWMLS